MANVYEIKTDTLIKQNIFFLSKQLWTDWNTKTPKGSVITIYHFNSNDDNSYTSQIKIPIPPNEIEIRPNQQIEIINLTGYVFLTKNHKLGISLKADNIKPLNKDWRMPDVNNIE